MVVLHYFLLLIHRFPRGWKKMHTHSPSSPLPSSSSPINYHHHRHRHHHRHHHLIIIKLLLTSKCFKKGDDDDYKVIYGLLARKGERLAMKREISP